MLELWLICHGETPWNSAGRALGQGDPPLSEFGIQQAERLAQRLAGISFNEVYASDLTAGALHRAAGTTGCLRCGSSLACVRLTSGVGKASTGTN